MLLRRGYGEHFDAAVPQIPDEAADAQLLGNVLGEIAEAHTLDHARDEIALGLFDFVHESLKL